MLESDTSGLIMLHPASFWTAFFLSVVLHFLLDYRRNGIVRTNEFGMISIILLL
jgi:hypothetical protein